jgi:outer membrane murein-binding lipoprotein Lpp
VALNRKQIVLLFLVSILSGCGQNSERINQLEMENIKLQFKLDQHEADIKHMDNEASVAAGCDLFIEFCPNAMTQRGHDAIKQGYSGAQSGWLWFAFIGKFAALGAGFAVLWFSIKLGRTYLLLPTQKKVHECLDIIREAEGREEQADRNVQYAYQSLEDLNKNIKMAQAELNLIEQRLQELSQTSNDQRIMHDAHQHINKTLDDL